MSSNASEDTTYSEHTSQTNIARLSLFTDLPFHNFHCEKSAQIWSLFWSVFFCIWTEYGNLRSKSPYLVQIQENTDQKKLRIWTLFT